MRSQLLASLTSKIVAGVAATTLAAGSAGAVAMTTISDEAPTPDSSLEQVIDGEGGDLAVDCDADDATLEVFEEEIDTDTADGGEDADDPCADDDSTDDDSSDDGDDSDDEGAEGEDEQDEADDDEVEEVAPVTIEDAAACADAAHPDGYANFGEQVHAVRDCGYHGGVSQLAHEKNAERKAAKAPVEETDDEADDEAEEVVEEEEEVTEEETDEVADEDGAEEEVEDDAAEVTVGSTDAPGAHGKGHAKKK